MVREVDLLTFVAAHADGGVVDVREPGEYLAGHVPGARLLPLAAVPARLGELPSDRPRLLRPHGPGQPGRPGRARPLATGTGGPR